MNDTWEMTTAGQARCPGADTGRSYERGTTGPHTIQAAPCKSSLVYLRTYISHTLNFTSRYLALCHRRVHVSLDLFQYDKDRDQRLTSQEQKASLDLEQKL